jgi:cytochrome P450
MHVQQLLQTFGPVAAITQSSPSIICVSGSVAVQQMLPRLENFHAPTMQPNVIADLQPQHFKLYHQHTTRVAHDIMQHWGVGRVVDVVYAMRRIVLRSACAMLFGVELRDDQEPYVGSVLQQWVQQHLAVPNMLFPRYLRPVLSRRPAHVDARSLFQPLVDRVAAGSGNHSAFLVSMFDDADMLEGMLALLAMMHELTAVTFGWTLCLLSQHVGVLYDLIEEVKSTLNREIPSIEQLERLPLLDGVVRESMRALPPRALAVRISAGACDLGSYQLPQGTIVLYSPYLVQRLSEFYYAPERFRPQRWSQIEPASSAFLPFGADPCARLAAGIALFQIKLVLALLCQHYQLVPVPGTIINRSRSLLLAPRGDISMIIAPVDRPIARREVHGTIRDVVYLP